MTTTEHSFEALPLAAQLQNNLKALGYKTPSPIQQQAIPSLLEGRDLLGSAQTGTGKTAAFSLPILHMLLGNPRRLQRNTTRCLVLAPTRELVVQVADSFAKYGKGVRFQLATVYGGVSQRPQVQALQRGLDVLVATPGRLLDLRQQGHLSLDGVEFFVLDEADRMLDMGFLPDIQEIVQDPEKRQTCFFSATFSPSISKLAASLLVDPVSVSVAPDNTTAEKVEHSVSFVEKNDKRAYLEQLLAKQSETDSQGRTLVFSKTKFGAEKLAKSLNQSGIRADSIHGDKSQAARQRALEQFRSGRSPVLVATDVAARGLDVRNITLVVNYDLPMDPESYVHRIGRTARAGASGVAISFCSDEDLGLLVQIERLIKKPINVSSEHEWHSNELEQRYLSIGKRSQKGGGSSNQEKRPFGGKRRPFGGKSKFGRFQSQSQSKPSNSGFRGARKPKLAAKSAGAKREG
jgi:ATP-dependent RNA helicase RhlE